MIWILRYYFGSIESIPESLMVSEIPFDSHKDCEATIEVNILRKSPENIVNPLSAVEQNITKNQQSTGQDLKEDSSKDVTSKTDASAIQLHLQTAVYHSKPEKDTHNVTQQSNISNVVGSAESNTRISLDSDCSITDEQITQEAPFDNIFQLELKDKNADSVDKRADKNGTINAIPKVDTPSNLTRLESYDSYEYFLTNSEKLDDVKNISKNADEKSETVETAYHESSFAEGRKLVLPSVEAFESDFEEYLALANGFQIPSSAVSNNITKTSIDVYKNDKKNEDITVKDCSCLPNEVLPSVEEFESDFEEYLALANGFRIPSSAVSNNITKTSNDVNKNDKKNEDITVKDCSCLPNEGCPENDKIKVGVQKKRMNLVTSFKDDGLKVGDYSVEDRAHYVDYSHCDDLVDDCIDDAESSNNDGEKCMKNEDSDEDGANGSEINESTLNVNGDEARYSESELEREGVSSNDYDCREDLFNKPSVSDRSSEMESGEDVSGSDNNDTRPNSIGRRRDSGSSSEMESGEDVSGSDDNDTSHDSLDRPRVSDRSSELESDEDVSGNDDNDTRKHSFERHRVSDRSSELECDEDVSGNDDNDTRKHSFERPRVSDGSSEIESDEDVSGNDDNDTRRYGGSKQHGIEHDYDDNKDICKENYWYNYKYDDHQAHNGGGPQGKSSSCNQGIFQSKSDSRSAYFDPRYYVDCDAKSYALHNTSNQADIEERQGVMPLIPGSYYRGITNGHENDPDAALQRHSLHCHSTNSGTHVGNLSSFQKTNHGYMYMPYPNNGQVDNELYGTKTFYSHLHSRQTQDTSVSSSTHPVELQWRKTWYNAFYAINGTITQFARKNFNQ